MALQYRDVSKMLDHALLKPEASDAELEAGCALALEYDVASVCIVPHALARCAELLRGSSVQPSTTIGFPHGAHTTRTKLVEAEQALRDGGTELDMVVNLGKVRSLEYGYVEAEIAALLLLTRDAGRKLKVIFENCYLERSHKLELCKICSELQVDWIKTSTGVGPHGATREDVELMLAHRTPPVQVKASGGVRSLSLVLELRALGVSRVGTSSTQAILDELRLRLAEPARRDQE
jgi:deoxyribose-phosphate aldolase